MSQGVFVFGPIDSVLSASLSVGLGINPSATTVHLPFLPFFPARVGTAGWFVGGTLVRQFPNSVLESVRVRAGEGGTTFELTILDRRWMWGQNFGQISGQYNTRLGPGFSPLREKNPRELATLCLQAMGETGFDVSALPINDRPQVDWEVANPAKALEEICSLYGCTVTLRLDNTVQVVQLGTGAAMPAGFLEANESTEGARIPSKLAVVTAPTEWEIDLELEPVGKEFEWSGYKPIAELSYTPDNGWYAPDVEETEFDKIENEEKRELAVEFVHRAYRVKLPDVENTPLEDAEIQPTELAQILPISPRKGGSGLPAVVHGRWQRDPADPGSETRDDDPVVGEDIPEGSRYEASFSIDEDAGVVRFNEPVLGRGENGEKIAPKLLLRCAINLYDTDARRVQRGKVEVDVDPTSPAGVAYELREDLIPVYTFRKEGEIATWTDNTEDVEDQAGFYVAQRLRNYQTFPAAEATYAGFVPIAPDGAIRQVSYSISRDGTATCQIARNTEDDLRTLTLAEARDRLSISQMIEQQRADNRKRNRDRKRERRDDLPQKVQ